MKKIGEAIKLNKLTKKLLVIIASLLLLICMALGTTKVIQYNIERKEALELPEISYRVYNIDLDNKYGFAVVTFANVDGIEQIIDFDGKTISANGKMKVAIDYKLKDRTPYSFNVKYKNGIEKDLTIDFEMPRRKGNYILKNGIYIQAPDFDVGYNKYTTRYIYQDTNGNLTPGNWIDKEEPENWYDYKNRIWANIFVESEGIESYYVWIPRYCYKVDTVNSVAGNERVDVKFINTYDEYIDYATGITYTWEELSAQGYIIPEAFQWDLTMMDGYWVSKYQLSDKTGFDLDYIATVNKTSISVDLISKFTTDVTYTYAINGDIEENSLSTTYTFNNVSEGNKYINVTAISTTTGSILASMTKALEVAEPNPPDLTGFDKDTTFYVYWDENGIEHNEVPISMDPPEEWYNYSTRNWANVLTRSNETESYFVWIPRYEYYINYGLTAIQAPNERVNIKFIKGTSTQTTSSDYIIPEAFTWGEGSNSVELTGYWVSKYQLSDKPSTPNVKAEITPGENVIRVSNITGTAITNNSGNLKYEYYINGVKEETNDTDTSHDFTGLTASTEYSITVIVRNATTNAYLGGATQKVKTIVVNKPDLTGFNKDQTYYVTYNNGTATVGDKIENDGSNAPSNWYDYSARNWANIVVTNGTVTDGAITGATYTTYLVWIPRYQYQLDDVTQRVRVKFIEGTSTVAETGYTIPEAFTWGEGTNTVQLPGYWVSKYQLSN